jgi:hypothetical protein
VFRDYGSRSKELIPTHHWNRLTELTPQGIAQSLPYPNHVTETAPFCSVTGEVYDQEIGLDVELTMLSK